jgi:hypothetical protein
VDIARHDADLDFFGCDDTGTIRPHQDGARTLHTITGHDHILHWNTLGDADDHLNTRINRLIDGSSGKGWWHIDD